MTAGEAWTREALSELRSDRYRPAAWRLFLARSFERAADTRSLRPQEHRTLVTFEALSLAGWVSVGVAGHPWLALTGAGWTTLLLLMVDWHLGLLENDDGRPLAGLGPANLLSIARGAVTPALLVVSPLGLALLLIPAGIIDAIDGPLARRRGEVTRLGRWLDGGLDACLLSVAAVGAAAHGVLPWWAAGLVLGRHAAQWLVLAVATFARAKAPARDGFVSGKLPGLILFAGLVLAALRLPGSTALVVTGSLGGLGTLAATVARSARATSPSNPRAAGIASRS